MRLLDKALIKRFAEVGSQEEVSDPLVITKFFNPTGAGTWYATEYDPIRREFFGYVSILGGNCDEWGYFSLDELMQYRGHFDIGIERDWCWKEIRASQVYPKIRIPRLDK